MMMRRLLLREAMTMHANTALSTDGQSLVDILQAELAATNREVMALTLDLESRVDQRTAELRITQEELQRTNEELMQLTLDLEDRVEQRTRELEFVNRALRAEIARRQDVEQRITEMNADLERRVATRTEELALANKELESFAYSVSHDLRSPLRGIDGWSLALLEDYSDRLDEQGKKYLGIVRLEAQRMGELIDALLELSRVMRREFRRDVVDLSALVAELAAGLGTQLSGRDVTWVIQPGVQVAGDAILLRAALRNLVENAWKFTSKVEHGVIEFGTMQHEAGLACFLRDNGAGFDMSLASKLFTPFQRLHSVSDFAGTGVGLATVQRIIRRHGGSIWATGETGHGATFFFTLGSDSDVSPA